MITFLQDILELVIVSYYISYMCVCVYFYIFLLECIIVGRENFFDITLKPVHKLALDFLAVFVKHNVTTFACDHHSKILTQRVY